MLISTKGRYSVTALLDLAIHDKAGPVTLADISQCQGISLSYLEQLFAKLRRNNIVSSTRGPGGGYKLTNNADEVSVSDIILAVDESCKVVDCNDSGACHGNDHQCLTHDLWQELSNEIRSFLDGITLSEIMSQDNNVQARQDKAASF